MYENPSAGKFEPPPPPEDPDALRPLSKRFWFVVLLLVSAAYPALLWLVSPSRKTRLGIALGLLTIPLAILHLILSRIKADESGKGGAPYTNPTHLTR